MTCPQPSVDWTLVWDSSSGVLYSQAAQYSEGIQTAERSEGERQCCCGTRDEGTLLHPGSRWPRGHGSYADEPQGAAFSSEPGLLLCAQGQEVLALMGHRPVGGAAASQWLTSEWSFPLPRHFPDHLMLTGHRDVDGTRALGRLRMENRVEAGK